MASPVAFPAPPAARKHLRREDEQSVLNEVDYWLGVLSERAQHGETVVRLDIKDGRIVGLRGGCEASARARRAR